MSVKKTELKKKENNDEFRKLGEQIEKLNEERAIQMRIMNQSEPDLGRVNKIIKEINDLREKQYKLM
jgi:hypothetical protein